MTFQFASINELFAMAGHGPYVWGSYVVTFAVLTYLLVSPLRKRRQLLAEQERLQRIAKQSSNRKSVGEVA